MHTTAAGEAPQSFGARALAFFLHEFRQVVPPTIFFAVGFNLIVFTQRLILAEYMIEFSGYLVAVVMALVVGKAVLVADKMPFLRRFDHSPLIVPILFKTVVYWAFVFIARLLEALVHYLFETGGVLGFGGHVADHFSWNRFLFIQTWILVLFLLYCTAAEISGLLGDGELFRVFFRYHPTELKRTRRQRARALVRLAALGRRYTAADFRDPDSAVHKETVALIEALAKDAADQPRPARAAPGSATTGG
jgi:hypothetical protein